MVIEWVAIAAALTPHIKKYAGERAEKLASKYADGVAAKIYRRVVPDKKAVRANEAFTARFGKELDSWMELDTALAGPYREALQTFLENPSVQDALIAPLDGISKLDWPLLRGIWNELRLMALPEGFGWEKLATMYGQSIERQKLTDPELRPVIAALAEIRSADANERSAAALEYLAGPRRAFDLIRYADAIRKAYAHLKLGSLDTDWAHYEERVRLESVYVPQSVKQAMPPRDLTRDYLRALKEEGREHGLLPDEERLRLREEYAQLDSRPLMEVVDDPGNVRLVILGDPGLGKSTLLKHLALRWAEDPARPLALFIELRRASGFAGVLEYLAHGGDHTCPLPEAELHKHLESHESLVLFDGLDEVTESIRSDVVSGVIRFAGDYPKARVIVTTRIHGYYPGSTHPDSFRDAGFRQFTLQDFDDPEIDRFIRLWHDEAFRDAKDRTRYESRMRKAIEDSQAIRELAANPLLLTMMAILSRNQDLPRDRNKLYEKCAELLLKNWDLEKFPELKEKKAARDIKDKLGPDQKMRVLEQVAAAMQRERTGLAGNLISENKLKEIVQAELLQLVVPEAAFVAADLIWMLRERNFMLGYLGDHQYAFVHRTFLEYFCARDLKYRLEKTSDLSAEGLREVFRTHWKKDEWQEVLRLLCGMIGTEYAADCVSGLLSQEKELEGERAVFLAAQCLQEIRELGRIWEIRRQTRARLILLTQFDLPYYYDDWNEGHEVSTVRSRAVKEVAQGWKDDADTLPWLRERAAGDDNWSVRLTAVRELASGWKDNPDTLRCLKDRVGRDEDQAVRWVAVEELARGWKDDPDTLPWLKDRATRDESLGVRIAAVHELARGWKNDPDTLPLMKDRATHDDQFGVRAAAVEELARHWKDDPDTLALLKDRAIHDPDKFSVRRTAVQKAARGWKGDPDTLPWLKDRAARDQHWDVREAAVQELARGWKGDPDTLPLLKELATHDDNHFVRSAALLELVRGWKDDRNVILLMKERVICDAHPYVRRSVIDGLRRDWKDDPEILSLLKDGATNDADEDVRQAAVRQLVELWKGDPNTPPFLKDCAARDNHRAVQQSAVRGLARGWNDDPDTLPWLKECAVHNDREDVRKAALRELARGWNNDPDTLPLLKDRSTHDDNEYVRLSALRELARGWKDNPDTLTLLKDRATGDDDASVRRVAVHELARGWKDDTEVQKFLSDLENSKIETQSE